MRGSAWLVLPLLLVALAPSAVPGSGAQGWAPGRNDERITMADGTVIDATMVVPAGTAPGARLPAIIAIHGYGGSKDVGSATEAARRGYVGFAYSTRGFGDSTGQMDVAGPKSMQDLKDLVRWLKDNGPVDPARVGVFGCSYGGGHALQLATMPDAGVATVVPCVPWSDLEQALRPNHAFKLSYTTGFYATGDGLVQGGCQPMCLSVAGVQLGRRALYDTYDPQVHLGFASMLTGVGLGADEQWFRERSALLNVRNIRIPIFIVQGLSDDLFPADQALPFFQLIPTPEKKLYLGFVGHPRAAREGPEVDYVRGLAWQWFDHFLRGIGPDPADPANPIEVGQQPWTGSTLRLADWPAPADAQRFALNGDGGLGAPGPAGLAAVANDGVAGLQDDPVLPLLVPVPPQVPDGTPADTLVFRTAPLARDTELLGTPRADLQLTSTGTEYQVAVKVFDASPDGSSVLVTRGIWDVPDNVPGVQEHVLFDLQPYRHAFPAGHAIEVRVAASDTPAYEPVRGAFVNVLGVGRGGSAILLPLCPGMCAER